MSISYNEDKKIFSLHTKNTTYQMMVDEFGHLFHLYYGPLNHGDMDYSIGKVYIPFLGNPNEVNTDRSYSLDALPQEFPTLGTGDFRNYALNIENSDLSQSCRLLFYDYKITRGKYELSKLPHIWAADDEAESLELILRDPVSDIEVSLLYGLIYEKDAITRSVIIRNKGNNPVKIKKAMTACLDFLAGDFDVINFYGKHAMERNFERVSLNHGTYSFSSRRGASSHQYNPCMILADKDTREDFGNCYGMLFVYSGNFLCQVEKDQINQTRILMGLNDEEFDYPLDSGEEFVVPEVIMSFSSEGLSKLSNNYHKLLLNNLCKSKFSKEPRPVLVNSWEAAYFDFNAETIVNLAKEAADLGIDMVVMDDGWFGDRNDDNSSLGDWYVNEEKLGCTLNELVNRVNDLGVKFGIWIEPEMINEVSKLYEKHPDWAIKINGRDPIRSRNQLVLDFSRKEIRDYIFEKICNVIDQANIEYIKWDMNRSLDDVYSGTLTYDYVLGLYEFYERLSERYPNILIEGCSGGGGRFDAGIMYYSPQIWTSDNTDAINRTRIQYGSSFFYPISFTGSHVSAVPNHQTGRITSLKTRGIVAMAGTFGYEMNLSKLDDSEKQIVKDQVKTYKKYEKLIRFGDYYRLSNPFEDEIAAWMFVSENKSEVLVNLVRIYIEANMPVGFVKLKGIDKDAFYIDEESKMTYSGVALMEVGIALPISKSEYEAHQFKLKKI